MKLTFVLNCLAASACALLINACGTHNPADPNVKTPVTGNENKTSAPPAVPDAPAAPVVTVPTDGPGTLEVLGSWHVPETEVDGVKTEMTVKLTDKLMTVEKTCSTKEEKVASVASGRVVIDAAMIDLQEPIEASASNTVDGGKAFDCVISFEKRRYDYELKEGQLQIKKDGVTVVVGDRKL